MIIRRADAGDVPGLARLLWLDSTQDEREQGPVTAFADELAQWWCAHRDSHHAFVARLPHGGLAGMAWVALLPRVPRPGATSRLSADVQSVFVLPEERGRGVGSRLVDAAAQHAADLGAARVTVHSGRRAVPVYERLGFVSSHRLLQRPPD